MGNAKQDESQARIKISGRNINNLRYVDDTILKVGSEGELKSLLMRKLNIQKIKIMASSPVTSWQIDGKQWKQSETLFWGAPKLP